MMDFGCSGSFLVMSSFRFIGVMTGLVFLSVLHLFDVVRVGGIGFSSSSVMVLRSVFRFFGHFGNMFLCYWIVTEMFHHKKSEHGWKKKHDAAERHDSTRTFRRYPRNMKEAKEPVKETVKTKRDAEDKVHSNHGKWRKNIKPATKEAAPHDIDEEPTTLEAVDPAPVPAEELSTLVDRESVVVEAVDPAPLVLVEPAAPAPAEEPPAPLIPVAETESLIAVEPIVTVE